MRIRDLLALLVFVVSLCNLARAGQSLRIVDAGQPRAVVSVPEQCDRQTREAAELLVRYVCESSGASLPIQEEPSADADNAEQPVTIHIGPGTFAGGLSLGLDSLDDDGFVLRAVDDRNYVIVGPTPWGTEFGVCEFLERCLGVRWLMPGPDGDDVPRHAAIDVPAEEIRQQPVFFSRQFSGLSGAQVTWARRNRMHARVEFHHNLHRLFPPESYTKTHPDFFPMRNGQRYFPATNDTHGWQPCFTAEGMVEEAVANICRYFDEHPDATSYSLGVVDSSGHCECPNCQAKDTGEKNFLGRRDVSDRYYGWCNQVVEGVLKKYPDKHFGCLAYSEVAQAPSRVRVHPRIIPFMTYDRMKWIDPELRRQGEEMTRRWQAMSPTLGWYDYIYGSAYCVPRVWFHEMADYYRFAQEHGVRALYAEAYPNWGEGPKLYVSLKLQWDPQQDVDALLRDWYTRAVGPKAADDLAAYYELWEDFWTRRILQSAWFTQQGQYLRFNDPGYLADVTEEDITRSRQLLEAVLAKAETEKQKARARLLLLAFEYYEASALAYGSGRDDAPSIRNDQQAIAFLDKAQRSLDMAAKRRRLVAEVFPQHPELMHRIDFDRYPRLSGENWPAGQIWHVFDCAAKSEPVREALVRLANSESSARLPAQAMLTMLQETSSPVCKNPSFEDAEGSWPADWSRWIKWGTGTMEAGAKAAHSGKSGIVCRGVRRGGPHQTVDAPPGTYGAMALVRVSGSPPAEATVSLNMTPLDKAGANLASISTTLPAVAGDWTRIATAGEIPAVDGSPTTRVRLIVIVDGLGPEDEVHIDDVAMFRVE